MAVSLRKAFKNVLSDGDFLSKFAILIVLSFCNGLLTFALIARNYGWLIPAAVLSVIATIIGFGYDFKYIKNLIDNENSEMPEWSGIGEFFITGTKYVAAVMLFAMAVGLILFVPIVLFACLSFISKVFFILMMLPFFLCILFEIYICFASLGMVYVFLDSDMDILSLFNFKKIFSYFSVSYFVALFAVGALAFGNGLLGSIATINLKYALLYIIPLIIAPFLRMINNNLIAQAYNANKNNEKGSVGKLFIYLALIIIITILFVLVSIVSAKVGV